MGGRCGTRADPGQGGADGDGLVLGDEDLGERAGERRRDLGVHLVGGDLEQRLVERDGVTDGLEPAGHGALGHALAERGHRHVLALAGRRGRRGGNRGGRCVGRGRGLVDGRRGGLGDGGLGDGGGSRGLGCGGLRAGLADGGQGGADGDGLVLGDEDLGERAGERRRDLGVHLVGGDLEQRLVERDGVTDGLEPAGHGALGHALAESGHQHGVRHDLASPSMGVSCGRAGACRRGPGRPRRVLRSASGARAPGPRRPPGRPPTRR